MDDKAVVGHLLRWRVRRGSLVQIRNLFEARPSMFCLKNECETLFELAVARNRNNAGVTEIVLERYGRHIPYYSLEEKKRLASCCIVHNNTELLSYVLEGVSIEEICYFYTQFILSIHEGGTECANMILDCFRERTQNSLNCVYKLRCYNAKFVFFLMIGYRKIKYYRQVDLECVVRGLCWKSKLVIYKTLDMITHHPFAIPFLDILRSSYWYNEKCDTRIRLQLVEKALVFYLLKKDYCEDVIRHILVLMLS